jgi:AraC-like DNA-binding protein
MYREHALPAPLRPFVDALWSGRAEVAGEYPVLPDGCIDIVFSPGGGLRVVGTMTTVQSFTLPAGEELAGVRFRTGAAGLFLHAAPGEFTDRSEPLDAVWGARARRLLDELGHAACGDARLSALTGSLAPRDDRNGVQLAIAAIAAADGLIDLDHVASHARLSPRQFRRRVMEETGLAPKHLCRVLRFRRALRLLEGPEPLGWAAIAADCGYYDQAHLIRDFREFSGSTPAAYDRFFQSLAGRSAVASEV